MYDMQQQYPQWQIPIIQGITTYFKRNKQYTVTNDDVRRAIKELASTEEHVPRPNQIGYSKLTRYSNAGIGRIRDRLNELLEFEHAVTVTPNDTVVVKNEIDITAPYVSFVFVITTDCNVTEQTISTALRDLYGVQAEVIDVKQVATKQFDVMLSSRVPRSILSDWLIDESWVDVVTLKPEQLFGK